MSFRPINDDHAVLSVAFSVHFDRPLNQRTIGYLAGQHHRWQADLPAMQMPQMFGIEVGAGGSPPRQIVGHGVEFSYLRPDGTPAWQLRCDGGSITVECTRYTRWDRVWQTAKTHLLAAVEVIVESNEQPDLKVLAAAIQYTDRFIGEPRENNFNEIFSENRFLSKASFEFGDIWHTHLGWFEKDSDGDPVLNNLNIDAKNDAAQEGSPIVVDILHLQQVRYNERLTILDFSSAAEARLETLMTTLHEQNKLVVREILEPQMKRRIGIEGGATSSEAEAI